MKYVIDSSVAFKWVVAEPDSDKAAQLREDYTLFRSHPGKVELPNQASQRRRRDRQLPAAQAGDHHLLKSQRQ